MTIRTILVLLLFGATSCGDFGRRWSDYIEYKFNSKNSVYWTREQMITSDLFVGEPRNDGTYYAYFGVNFLWDKGDKLKFNIRIFFDKKKSWIKPESEWGDYPGQFHQVPKLLKLKFDYLEFGARRLRKYLTEKNEELNDDNVKHAVDSHWDKAYQEWTEIQRELGDDISDSKLNPVREMVDKKLQELVDFDTKVNSDL